MRYDKLVRDKIPEIIRGKGKIPITYIAGDREYNEKLYKKLLEEVLEFISNDNEEELADILEVFYAICKNKDTSIQDIEKLRLKKHEERGGLEGKIILKEVKED